MLDGLHTTQAIAYVRYCNQAITFADGTVWHLWPMKAKRCTRFADVLSLRRDDQKSPAAC